VTSLDFLEVDDLDPARLAALLRQAQAWKAAPGQVPDRFGGQGVALLFEKPSARTRTSTELAASTLGAHPVYLRGEEVGIGSRETIEDIARTLASYCTILCARVFDHATLEAMARAVDAPVVNLLSDREHPCQALADLLTLQELLGGLDGRRVAYVGDGNNVARSLALIGSRAGLEVVVASPEGYELEPGAGATLVRDPAEAAHGASAIYTDVWVSMGDEETAAARRAAFAGYQVDDALLDLAAPDAIALHDLPAHAGEEITAAVLYGPRQRIWDQAENRRHAQKALLEWLLA